MGNIFAFIKVLLLLIVVIVNGLIAGFIFYTEQKHDCQCGPEWRRGIIKYGALIMAGLAVIAFFTPILSVIKMIPIVGGLFLFGVFGLCVLMIYCIQQFLKDVQADDCSCKEKSKLGKANDVIGPLGIATLALIALGIIVVIFYLL